MYHHHPNVLKWPLTNIYNCHKKYWAIVLNFIFIQHLLIGPKKFVCFYILKEKYLYFILYILQLSRAVQWVKQKAFLEELEARKPGRVTQLFSWQEVDDKSSHCLLLYCYLLLYIKQWMWAIPFLLESLIWLINYWNKSWKTLILLSFMKF